MMFVLWVWDKNPQGPMYGVLTTRQNVEGEFSPAWAELKPRHVSLPGETSPRFSQFLDKVVENTAEFFCSISNPLNQCS